MVTYIPLSTLTGGILKRLQSNLIKWKMVATGKGQEKEEEIISWMKAKI